MNGASISSTRNTALATDRALTKSTAITVPLRGAYMPKLANMIVSQDTRITRNGVGIDASVPAKSLSDMWADTAAAGGNAPTVDDAKATQVNFVLHLGFHTQAADAVAQFRTAVEFSKRCPSRVVVLCPQTEEVMSQ